MTPQVAAIFDRLWQQYLAITPSAGAIHALLGGGQPIVNDHIALRGLAGSAIDLEALARPFLAAGYHYAEEYQFPTKKLYARHLQHEDADAPKVFISELKLHECSAVMQQIFQRLLAQLPVETAKRDDLPWAGRLWQLSQADYLQLADESEYGGWVAAWGLRANHFTVSVNQLQTTLEAVNQQLLVAGFRLNQQGGVIKGSPAELLEQSATVADLAVANFSDGDLTLPGCFYEFARRYPQADGQLYSGFIAASADKIFSSTDRRS